MKTAIGVDIGGTKISMVLGTEKGKILACREIPTLTGKKTRQGVRNLVDNLHQLIQDASVKKRSLVGIGVGIPGAVNSKKGLVPRSPHLGGWKNLPLRRILERGLKLPVAMKNDANAAAIGEKYFGACKKAEHFIYVTVSTGVGGGLVVNGKLVEGCNYVGGEIGHISVVPLGDSCKCGKNGCLEAYASGTAITRYVKRELKKYPKSKIKKLAKGSSVSAKVIGLAAKKGDVLALKAFRRAGFFLGIGLADLLNVLNPEVVVLGGGVWKSAPRDLWRCMISSCKADAWPEAFRRKNPTTVRRWIKQGFLPAIRLPGHPEKASYLIRRQDVEKLLELKRSGTALEDSIAIASDENIS